jgi:hypothetical protein
VRQAAIVNQNVGYARVFSRYLVDHYPHAFYEANQRNANTVPMKQMLLMEGLLTSGPAVLGYSDKYVALLSSTRLRPMYFSHYLKKEKNDDVQQLSDSGIKSLGLRCHGQYWEAESVAERAFSPLRFFKEVNGDDLYLGRFSKNENDNKHYYSEQERVYIKTPKFQI